MPTAALKGILKDLEKSRDVLLSKANAQNLVEEFRLMQVNIFVSTFFYAITEISEDISDLSKTYISYLKTRHNAARYLLELYLTLIHIAQLPKEEALRKVYSLRISGKIIIHQMNLRLHSLTKKLSLSQEEEKQILETLNINRISYRSFIKEFGKIAGSMPDELDGFFDGVEVVKDFEKIFGFKFLKNNKIKYGEEIQNNTSIPEVIKELLIVQYPLLSLEAHPTPASLIDFELFIASSNHDKAIISKGRSGAVDTQLIMIGSLMKDFIEKILTE